MCGGSIFVSAGDSVVAVPFFRIPCSDYYLSLNTCNGVGDRDPIPEDIQQKIAMFSRNTFVPTLLS